MADPRGRGFKRGHGKWHAPDYDEINKNRPCAHGWTRVGTGEHGQDIYFQHGVACYFSDGRHQPETGWVIKDADGNVVTSENNIADITQWFRGNSWGGVASC